MAIVTNTQMPSKVGFVLFAASRREQCIGQSTTVQVIMMLVFVMMIIDNCDEYIIKLQIAL